MVLGMSALGLYAEMVKVMRTHRSPHITHHTPRTTHHAPHTTYVVCNPPPHQPTNPPFKVMRVLKLSLSMRGVERGTFSQAEKQTAALDATAMDTLMLALGPLGQWLGVY